MANKVTIHSNVFSEERLQYFAERGLTPEEIADLEAAQALVDEMTLIQNPERAIDNIESLPDDPKAAMKEVFEMGIKKPDEFAEMMAAVDAIDQIVENQQSK